MGEDEREIQDELPLTIGGRLRAARKAAGLGREDIAARTKIAERHLVAIEEDRFSDLAGRTYAVGFARAYARAVGLDEAEIASAVRAQLDVDEQAYPRAPVETFEPGDPARVPTARLAWAAAIGGVVAVLVFLALFWPSFLMPQGSLPDLLRDRQEDTVETPAPAPAPGGTVQAGGAVVFTATEPRVWVKFYDATGNQLFQKEMADGERYVVPKDVAGPLLWTARPDALEINVGGKILPRLADKPVTMKDVSVRAADLLAMTATSAAQRAPARENGAVSTIPAPDSTVSE